MIRYILLTLGILIPCFSAAAESSSGAFADWTGLNNLLREKGIEPSMINWGSVDPMCISLQTDEDDTAFNQCRYEKILLMRRFNANRASCQTRSQADYPDRLLLAQPVQTFTAVDSTGKTDILQQQGQPISAQELEDHRNADYDGCMHGLGWISSLDWTVGNSTPTPVIP